MAKVGKNYANSNSRRRKCLLCLVGDNGLVALALAPAAATCMRVLRQGACLQGQWRMKNILSPRKLFRTVAVVDGHPDQAMATEVMQRVLHVKSGRV